VKLVLHVDGGARGNPGPAAIGVVISHPDGTVVDELAERIGTATNNVAEYRAVLRGLQRAKEPTRSSSSATPSSSPAS
jgi:ribonuclease HI